MFIWIVDEALEQLVRAEVPFPEELGDVSFDAPSGDWAAALSRPTVNLFLYDVTRSGQPNRAPIRRVDENGKGERRAPQPMVDLTYLVSAWMGDARDEHQLLGDVLSRMAGLDLLPEKYLPRPLSSSVHLSFVDEDRHRLRDIWTAAGGTLKAGFSVHAAVAADAFDWLPEAPAITSVSGSTRRGGLPKNEAADR